MTPVQIREPKWRSRFTNWKWLIKNYEELLLPLGHRVGKTERPVGVKTPLWINNCWHVSGVASECRGASHAYTFHVTLTREMRADELMRKMSDEEVMGLTEQNKPLLAAETRAARKVAESRRYVARRCEVAIPWKDDESRRLYYNKNTAEDRLSFPWETPSAKARSCWGNTAKLWKLIKPKVTSGNWSREKLMNLVGTCTYLIFLWWERTKRLPKWEQSTIPDTED